MKCTITTERHDLAVRLVVTDEEGEQWINENLDGGGYPAFIMVLGLMQRYPDAEWVWGDDNHTTRWIAYMAERDLVPQ